LLARRRDGLDDRQLAEEVLGIRGAPAALARKLVAQALVLEDRRDAWRRTGERICEDAPVTPGVYILKDEADVVLYVGKAVNVRRRLRAHFSGRRWRSAKAAFVRAVSAEWYEVGSDIEALLREASLIAELQPTVNVQTAAPAFDTRAIPPSLVRDVVIVVPSVEDDSAELIAARPDGAWMMQRTRRNGADLAVHTQRVWRFFFGLHRITHAAPRTPHLAPLVYSWLARRGASATRLDPHADVNVRALRSRLAALLRDERLFHERLEQC
jgi:predicted GIY-YIG superfamily endonuclease